MEFIAMGSDVFVRPNLKGFVYGAAFLLCFHSVMQHIEGGVDVSARPNVPSEIVQWTDADYQMMQDFVSCHPSAEGYYKLGLYLQRVQQFRKAKSYFRQAETLGEIADEQ